LLVYGYDTGPHPVNNPTTFGPDDARPANHRLALVDPVSGRLLFQAGIGEVQAVRAIAWSPDGKWLAVGGLNGNLLLFNAATLTLQVDAGAVEPGFVLSVSFSPDSRTLITGGSSGAVSFWTVPDLGREGQRLVVGNDATYAWYNPAGEVVGFASDEAKPNSSAHRWFDFPARPDELVRAACALAGADITPAQWAQYVGDQPYRHVCT
jgi:hypothetical protein